MASVTPEREDTRRKKEMRKISAMKNSCLMIIVLLAIAVANGSSTMVHKASGGIPIQMGGEKNALADETRTGERTQESKQISKACITQEACRKKAAICFKKCTNLPGKDHEKCIARCNKCVPSC